MLDLDNNRVDIKQEAIPQEKMLKSKLTLKTIGVYSSSTPIISMLPAKAQRIKKFFEKNNINVIWGNLAFSKDDYRTGTPKQRADEINELMSKGNIDLIISSIGGSNTSSILEYLDYEKIKLSNTKILGHSDTTALCLAVYAKTKKITYYSSSFMVGFDNQKDINDYHLNMLVDTCLNDKLGLVNFPTQYTEEFIPWDNTTSVPIKKMKKNEIITIFPGVAEGILIGGNLSTFIPLIGTQFFPEIEHETILFFEDTCQNSNLSLAQIEKNLASLKNTGILHKINGLIIGKCEGFAEIFKGKKYHEFISEFICELKIPIIANTDFAHTLPITSIPIGAKIKLDATRKKLFRIN